MEVYENKQYDFAERAVDLVSKMTLEEKVTQLGNQAPAIPRLKVPAYNYWSEASHGYFGPFKCKPMDVTSFPVCLGMSQSWDTEKMEAVAAAISDECRAHHNVNGAELHMWCPTINLARDPRNGRSDENFGEDPLLAGKMAAAYVRGMQGDGKYLKTVATPKHYALNSSENNRHQGSSNVDEATLREYYAKVFERVIKEGGAKSIMTSYNRVNGVPASVNEMLLTTLLREEWGFDGFVVSDCGAVLDLYENPAFNGGVEKCSGHYYAKDARQASVMALKAGCDMSCGAEHKKNLLDAVEQGMIEESVIDRALVRIFTSRFALGLFDEEEPADLTTDAACNEERPFAGLTKESICNEEKKKLSVDMANESIVLLKNEKGLLPLKKEEIKSILVIGPNAIYRELGGYSAGSMSKVVETVVNVLLLDAVKKETENSGIEVRYEKGWCTEKEFGAGGVMNLLPGAGSADGGMANMENLKETVEDMFGEGANMMEVAMAFMAPDKFAPEDADKCADADMLWKRAKKAAEHADVVIVVAGTDSATASEEHDRETLALPYGQDEKIQELLEINDNTIVVLNTLGAVTGTFLERAHSVVNAHFAGQEQGTAIANVLFGKVNPNAKLTATWYRSMDDLAHVNDYGIKKQDTLSRRPRTYMYLEKEPLFPFGYGLSYTSYEYGNLKLGKGAYGPLDVLEVSVDVTNAGKMDGAEIVQLYVSKVISDGMADDKPRRQLKAFAKVFLAAGETHTVTLQVPIRELAFWSYYENRMIVEPGEYRVEIGRSSADIVCVDTFTVEGAWQAALSNVYVKGYSHVLHVGETSSIEMTVVREDTSRLKKGEYETVCQSSNPEVAEVSDEGVVTAKSPGVATIVLTVSREGEEKTARVVFAVKE